AWQPTDIGRAIPAMVCRVKVWLGLGLEVRILTARANPIDHLPGRALLAKQAVEDWCRIVFGRALPVTHEKDYKMRWLFDDRAIQVEANTGRIIGTLPEGL